MSFRSAMWTPTRGAVQEPQVWPDLTKLQVKWFISMADATINWTQYRL